MRLARIQLCSQDVVSYLDFVDIAQATRNN